jgi:hypothetical protein
MSYIQKVTNQIPLHAGFFLWQFKIQIAFQRKPKNRKPALDRAGDFINRTCIIRSEKF